MKYYPLLWNGKKSGNETRIQAKTNGTAMYEIEGYYSPDRNYFNQKEIKDHPKRNTLFLWYCPDGVINKNAIIIMMGWCVFRLMEWADYHLQGYVIPLTLEQNLALQKINTKEKSENCYQNE